MTEDYYASYEVTGGWVDLLRQWESAPLPSAIIRDNYDWIPPSMVDAIKAKLAPN